MREANDKADGEPRQEIYLRKRPVSMQHGVGDATGAIGMKQGYSGKNEQIPWQPLEKSFQ